MTTNDPTASAWMPALSILLAALGYLWGSVLPAEWLSRRRTGSSLQDIGENPGASATWRVLGARAGLFVVAFDLLKGAIPFLAAFWLRLSGPWLVLPSLAPVIGHNWPLGRWRRGGHGLAPGGGVILSAGFPVMVYSALFAAIPAAVFFRPRWGVVLASIGVPLGLVWMVRAGYRPDVIAVVIAVMAVLALRLATARRTTHPPAGA
jgi:glycerol-3-phosphate acyltransferase PlsY